MPPEYYTPFLPLQSHPRAGLDVCIVPAGFDRARPSPRERAMVLALAHEADVLRARRTLARWKRLSCRVGRRLGLLLLQPLQRCLEGDALAPAAVVVGRTRHAVAHPRLARLAPCVETFGAAARTVSGLETDVRTEGVGGTWGTLYDDFSDVTAAGCGSIDEAALLIIVLAGGTHVALFRSRP